jgi:uncharacterized membrane protein YeiH
LRDVLCAEMPLILRKEIYATASMAGAAVYAVSYELAKESVVTTLIPMAIVFAIRLAAIWFGIHRSTFAPDKEG